MKARPQHYIKKTEIGETPTAGWHPIKTPKTATMIGVGSINLARVGVVFSTYS